MNVFKQFERWLPSRPLEIGTVVQVDAGGAIVELIGSGRLRARGAATLGQRVFVRDSTIEGEAPMLPMEVLTV